MNNPSTFELETALKTINKHCRRHCSIHCPIRDTCSTSFVENKDAVLRFTSDALEEMTTNICALSKGKTLPEVLPELQNGCKIKRHYWRHDISNSLMTNGAGYVLQTEDLLANDWEVIEE